MDRPSRHNDGASADREDMCSHTRDHPDRAATLQQHCAHVALNDNARTPRGGILQVRDERRLLGAAPTAKTTIAARIVLRAALHVPWQQTVMASHLTEAANQNAVSPRRRGIGDVNAEP